MNKGRALACVCLIVAAIFLSRIETVLAQADDSGRAIRTPKTVKITPAIRREAAERAAKARAEAEAKAKDQDEDTTEEAKNE